MDKESAKRVLEEFCSFPISSADEVLYKFKNLPGAVSRFDGDKRNFVYIPGTREDRVLLVAHADTVWDPFYNRFPTGNQTLRENNGVYTGADENYGIGADDRAGCAILYCLKDCGHSLLIVDGEEQGQIGSNYIKDACPEFFDELNGHSYVIQFDRQGNSDYKVYNLPVTEEFTEFIEESTGYVDAGKNARTDIVALCRDICGVNLSIGYYDEHTPNESLVFDDWLKTLMLAETLLKPKQKRYPLAYNL